MRLKLIAWFHDDMDSLRRIPTGGGAVMVDKITEKIGERLYVIAVAILVSDLLMRLAWNVRVHTQDHAVLHATNLEFHESPTVENHLTRFLQDVVLFRRIRRSILTKFRAQDLIQHGAPLPSALPNRHKRDDSGNSPAQTGSFTFCWGRHAASPPEVVGDPMYQSPFTHLSTYV